MDSFLNSVGLSPELGLVILLLAMSCGIIIGGGTVVVGNSLPFDFADTRNALISALAILAGAGLIGAIYVIGLLFANSPSIPPVIVASGIGLLAGPLFIQSLGHLRIPFPARSLIVIAFECLIITVAATELS